MYVPSAVIIHIIGIQSILNLTSNLKARNSQLHSLFAARFTMEPDVWVRCLDCWSIG